MHAAILELLGEAGVVGPEEANVGDVKQHHGQALQPQPAGCKMPQHWGPRCLQHGLQLLSTQVVCCEQVASNCIPTLTEAGSPCQQLLLCICAASGQGDPLACQPGWPAFVGGPPDDLLK